MPRNNGSHAYDLSLFEPRKAKVIELKPNKKLEKARRKKEDIQSVLNTLSVLAVAVIAITVMCMMIGTRVELTELEGEMKQIERQINELDSEYIRLTDELARKSSAQNIEEYARDVLGMQKLDPSQITYIEIIEEEAPALEETKKQNFVDKISDWLADLFG